MSVRAPATPRSKTDGSRAEKTWLEALKGYWARLRGETPAATAEEVEAIVEAAEILGVRPILSPDDLNYQGVQSLGARHAQLRDWIRENCSDNLCVRVRLGEEGQVSKCWIITSEPNGAEVETVRNLILLRGWDVQIHPATEAMVALAVGQDQTLSARGGGHLPRSLAPGAGAGRVGHSLRGAGRSRCDQIPHQRRDAGVPLGRAGVPAADDHHDRQLPVQPAGEAGCPSVVISRPLNASAQTKVDDQNIALRFATAPDIRGVDIFIRVWRPDAAALKLGDLGYRKEHIGMLREAIGRPYGVIVFSGPTGSGKSSSLTALLDDLPPPNANAARSSRWKSPSSANSITSPTCR